MKKSMIPVMNQNRAALVLAAVLTVGIGALWSASPAAATAAAAGSDDPTPYTVSTTGVTLPAGSTFPDGGHVNIRTTMGDKGIHFESLNSQPTGQWVGASFLPWSAFGLTCGFDVTWVQVSLFNEHYGEGGQSPLSVPCDTPPVEPPADPLVEVCWNLTAPGTESNVTWPQTHNPTCEPPCETTVQVDTYPTSAVAGLTADGFLEYKEDWGVAQQWRFIVGAACVVVEPPVVVPPVTTDLPPALALTGADDVRNGILLVVAVLAVLSGLILWAVFGTWSANHKARHRADKR